MQKLQLHRVSKNRTPTIFWHNFAKTSRLWIIFGREDQEVLFTSKKNLPKKFGIGREPPA